MSEENPWTTLGSRLVYENDWIKLREDKVLRPDGKPGIYSVVSSRVATGVVALTEEGQIYLVGQYRYPTNNYSWEIIEGGANVGESPLEAAKRELREEAGLVAERWDVLGEEVHLSNCFSSEVAMFYVARDLTEVEAEPDATEVLALKKVAAKEAFDMVHSGVIKDAMSIIALGRLERDINKYLY